MTLELPSLEEIQEIDRQRLQAIEALQISKCYVKCQRLTLEEAKSDALRRLPLYSCRLLAGIRIQNQ
jgi:hypothetical protein